MRKTQTFFLVILVIAIAFSSYLLLRGSYQSNVSRDVRTKRIGDLWEDNDYEQVLREAEPFLTEFPEDAYIMLLYAFSQFNTAFLEKQDKSQIDQVVLWDSARRIQRVLELEPSNPWKKEAYYVLGKVHYFLSKNNLEKSIRYFEKAKDLGIVSDDIDDYLAAAFRDIGDYDNAERIIRNSIELQPRFELFVVLLNMYLDKKQNTLISDTLRSVSEFAYSEEEKEILDIVKARNFINLNKLEMAKEILLQILESNSSSAEAYFYLGNVNEMENKLVQARYNWRQAYKIMPTWEDVIVKLRTSNN